MQRGKENQQERDTESLAFVCEKLEIMSSMLLLKYCNISDMQLMWG